MNVLLRNKIDRTNPICESVGFFFGRFPKKNMATWTVGLLLVPSHLCSQSLTPVRAEEFIQSLIRNERTLDSFVDQSTLDQSNRLGIEYAGIDHKYLISYDLEDSIKQGIKRHELEYRIDIQPLQGDFSRLVISIPSIAYRKDYYFCGEQVTGRSLSSH